MFTLTAAPSVVKPATFAFMLPTVAAVVAPSAPAIKLGVQDFGPFDAWRTQPSFTQRQAAEQARLDAQYDAWVDANVADLEAQSEVDEWESAYSQMVSPW